MRVAIFIARVAVGIMLAVIVLYVIAPALQGYHLGCDALIDHSRIIRLGIEWCK